MVLRRILVSRHERDGRGILAVREGQACVFAGRDGGRHAGHNLEVDAGRRDTAASSLPRPKI